MTAQEALQQLHETGRAQGAVARLSQVVEEWKGFGGKEPEPAPAAPEVTMVNQKLTAVDGKGSNGQPVSTVFEKSAKGPGFTQTADLGGGTPEQTASSASASQVVGPDDAATDGTDDDTSTDTDGKGKKARHGKGSK